MDSSAGQAAERVENYERQQAQVAVDRKKLAELRQITEMADEIFKASLELDSLEQEQKKLANNPLENAKLLAERKRLREANDALKNDPDVMAREAELKAEIAETGQTSGSDFTVRIQEQQRRTLNREALPPEAWPADRPLRVAVTISGGNPDPAQLESLVRRADDGEAVSR